VFKQGHVNYTCKELKIISVSSFVHFRIVSLSDDNTKDTKITSSSETILHGLKKYTNYSMQVLAFTSGGDGVRSVPIHCQTEQDGTISQNDR